MTIMRIAFISDLHASLIPLEAVLEDIRAAGVDQVVCLGDIVDMGPEPHQTIARMRQLGCDCIIGNHDPLPEVPHPLLGPVVEWTRDQLDDEDRAWLAALPPTVEIGLADGVTLLGVHGSPRSYDDQILCDTPEDVIEEMLAGASFDVLVSGHVHVQMVRPLGARLLVNVGSVAMPFERPFTGAPPRLLPWAEYGIVGWERGSLSIDLRRVPFDFAAYRNAIYASGLPDPDAWMTQWDAR
jgi:predicted phosphodiesterase